MYVCRYMIYPEVHDWLGREHDLNILFARQAKVRSGLQYRTLKTERREKKFYKNDMIKRKKNHYT